MLGSLRGVVQGLPQGGDVLGDVVGQVRALGVAPDLLDGVEFRGRRPAAIARADDAEIAFAIERPPRGHGPPGVDAPTRAP